MPCNLSRVYPTVAKQKPGQAPATPLTRKGNSIEIEWMELSYFRGQTAPPGGVGRPAAGLIHVATVDVVASVQDGLYWTMLGLVVG